MSLFFLLFLILVSWFISIPLLSFRVLVGDRKESECPLYLSITELLDLISDILHIKLVFLLTRDENNKRTVSLIIFVSLVTSSSVISVILSLLYVLDNFEIIFLCLVLGIDRKEPIKNICQDFFWNRFTVSWIILTFRVVF